MIFININNIEVFTNKYGCEYKIIEDFGLGETSNGNPKHDVKIKFIKSGYEKIVSKHDAIKGNVIDNSLNKLDLNTTYTNNIGLEYTIIEEIEPDRSIPHPRLMVKIKFIKSGYENIVGKREALKGIVRDNSVYELDLSKIYTNKNGLSYMIINDIGCIDPETGEKINKHIVEIKFLESENTYYIQKNVAINNKAIDYIKKENDLYKERLNNAGYKYRIIKDYGYTDIGNGKKAHLVDIQFLESKSVRSTRLEQALDGSVRDMFAKSVYGVGYIGNYAGILRNNIVYDTWRHMLSRCYNKDSAGYANYGGIGVTVSQDWLCFANFAHDVQFLQGYQNKILQPNMYQLDKDYLQMNIPKQFRIYSKYTCIWISSHDNALLSFLEKYKYVGVVNINGLYHCSITINGIELPIGIYTSEIAAANAYNYYHNKYYPHSILNPVNNVPFMPPNEFIKYRTNIKILCNIVK